MNKSNNSKKIIQNLINTPEFQDQYKEEKRRLIFAIKIKRLIERLQITQEELSKKMNVKPSYISRVVNGKTNINGSTIQKICESLDVSFEFVV